MKPYCFLIALFTVSALQAQDYFKNFEKVDYLTGDVAHGCSMGLIKYDSLNISVDLTEKAIVKDIHAYRFTITNNEKNAAKRNQAHIWIGVKDSTLYSFKNNNLKKPVLLFSFKKVLQTEEKVLFHPFGSARLYEDLLPDSKIPTVEGDRYFSFTFGYKEYMLFKGFYLEHIELSLNRGLFISILDEKGEFRYFSPLEIY